MKKIKMVNLQNLIMALFKNPKFIIIITIKVN